MFPLLFFIIYIFEIIAFQSKEGLLNLINIAASLGGFITGLISVILISMVYFFRTNKDIFQIIGIIKKKKSAAAQHDPEEPTHEEVMSKNRVHTEYYLNNNFRWKHTRSANHYPESVIRSVYKQHHANAFFIEVSSIILIILFGLLMDNPIFRIPAAASIVLLIAILIVLTGAFYYWMGPWKLIFFILIILFVNAMMHSNLMSYKNKVYGLNYDSSSVYSLEQLKVISDTAYANKDIRNTLQILENRKNIFSAGKEKPKLVFINCSGGGLRAMSFTMQVLQHADSLTDHKLMQQCPLSLIHI